MQRKAEARALPVEELVDRAKRGLIRVPSFQRKLKWDETDVVRLLDSIYRGYPVGSLLLWERPAPAAKIAVGPLRVEAPETSAAWWVVDGQQRLTALAASLARTEDPDPAAEGDPYQVFFDPREGRFHSASEGEPLDHWVGVHRLLDAALLGDFLYEWPHGRDQSLRRAVLGAGQRLREYRVPLYIVGTDDEAVLRDIFFRVNNFGKRLEWSEVHDALLGGAEGAPSTLAELTADLRQVGMGILAEPSILTCLLGLRGLDVTRDLSEHMERDPRVLDGAVAEAAPVFRRVLSFLRERCAVVHLGLLPSTTPLTVLVRFFALHPEPNGRSLELLARWIWRGFLGDAFSNDRRSVARRGVAAIDPRDEEESVQRLLALVGKEREAYVLPDDFDARSSESRLALLGLASLRPRDLRSGRMLDVAAHIEEHGAEPFGFISSSHSSRATELSRSPANRMIHPGSDLRALLVPLLEDGHRGKEVLASHAIDEDAAHALRRGDFELFLIMRAKAVQGAVLTLAERMARWEESDRPSIAHLLAEAE